MPPGWVLVGHNLAVHAGNGQAVRFFFAAHQASRCKRCLRTYSLTVAQQILGSMAPAGLSSVKLASGKRSLTSAPFDSRSRSVAPVPVFGGTISLWFSLPEEDCDIALDWVAPQWAARNSSPHRTLSAYPRHSK